MDKYKKLYKKIDKICRKKRISVQKDIAFNGDLHLQFRRKVGYLKSDKYKFYGIDYTECYISCLDLRSKSNWWIIHNLKGFIYISFKSEHSKHSQDLLKHSKEKK